MGHFDIDDDDDDEVRSTLPPQMLVIRLNGAYSNAKQNKDDALRNTLILTTGEIGRYRERLRNVVITALTITSHCKITP